GVEGHLVGVLLGPGQGPDGQTRSGACSAGGLGAATAGAQCCQSGDRQGETGESGAASGLHHCCLQDVVRARNRKISEIAVGACKLIPLTCPGQEDWASFGSRGWP